MELQSSIFSIRKYSTGKIFLLSCLIVAVIILRVAYSPLYHYWHTFIAERTQQEYGSKMVDAEHEAFIRAIAQEMQITQPFEIRFMNTAALQKFGYYNAFAYSPDLWNIIPLDTQQFLFISQGFFEDLSAQEQRFLIGHELAHIHYRHALYINLLCLLLAILTFMSIMCLGKALKIPTGVLSMRETFSKPMLVLVIAATVIGLSCRMMQLAYRRFVERQADVYALTHLHAHEGLMKIADRWQDTFKVPDTTSYWGLFADHPSHSERKEYCKHHQLTIKEQL